MNSIFGIKNTKFIISLKKNDQISMFGTFVLIVNDGFWQNSIVGVVNAGYRTLPKVVVHNDGQ